MPRFCNSSHTWEAISEHQYILRSDIKDYYSSIRFDVLMEIIRSYIKHPVLLTLIGKTCRRTETRGGIFYDFDEKGIPKGSPLSPLLGAIALITLDKAMSQVKDIFYARFMDDWVVLTKSKSALRKIVKITHEVVKALKFQLHPSKTYIGKISHGFNFLAYYMDDQKILPSKETIRRFHERAAALYESPHTGKNISRRYHKTVAHRDISEYQVNEPAPTEAYFKNIITNLLSLAARSSDTLAAMQQYVDKWACWLKLGLSSIEEFEHYVQALLPSVFSCWTQAPKAPTLGDCR